MECYVLPIRKLASKERKKNSSNKYKNNQKIVFKKLTFYLRGDCELFFSEIDLTKRNFYKSPLKV